MLMAALARDFGRLLEMDGEEGDVTFVGLEAEFMLLMVVVLVIRVSGRFLSG